MKKYQKILLATSACLIVGGGILGVAGIAMGGSPSFMITDQGIQTPEDLADGEFVEKTLPLKGVSSLEIKWDEGDIEFVEGDSFHAEYGYDEKHMQVSEQTKNGTWYFTGRYVQSIDITGIHFFWDSSVWERQESYLKIYVPKGTKISDINVINNYGKVKIDLSEITAEHVKMDLDSGDLEMKGLSSQDAELNLEYGDLELESCSFTDLALQNENGKCSLSDIIAESAELNQGYGDLEMQECEIAKLAVENEGGTCSLSGLQAEEAAVTACYGELALEQVRADQVTLTNESGGIRVDGLTGKTMAVENEYGGITLNEVVMETSIRAEQENETLRMDQVKAGQIEIINENGDLEGSGVEISTGNFELSYGECNISGFSAKDVKITNESGEINLELTGEEEDYSMLLKTEYGEVYVNGEDRGSDMTLERDKAGNRLELTNEDGNITIRTR